VLFFGLFFLFLLLINRSKIIKLGFKNKVTNKKKSKQQKKLNQISYKKTKSKKCYYKFGTFKLIKNNIQIIKEKNIEGCIVCNVEFGKIANYIIGKNSNLEYDNFKINLPVNFDNYFVILQQACECSEFGASIKDPYTNINYRFKIKIYHNGKLIKQTENIKDIPIINHYNELEYKAYKENIDGKQVEYWKNKDSFETSRDLYRQINQYSVWDGEFVYFYFYKKECLQYYMAMEICKEADELFVLPNKFDDDIETINYCAKFHRTKIENINFLFYCLNKNNGNQSFYTKKQLENIANTIGGYAIYKIPCIQYFRGLDGKYEYINKSMQRSLSIEQKRYYKYLVELIYQKYNKPVNFQVLPEKFCQNIICEDFMYEEIRKAIKEINGFKNSKNSKINYNDAIDVKLLNDKYKKLKQFLYENNIIKSKWKSEYELFEFLLAIYPDAIYQYHSKWLGNQSLDIFIPSLNIGIEYQGIQHYQSVEIWGGIEGLKRRKFLDEQKKELCRLRNVILIEWRYDEPINKPTLIKKLNEKS